MQSPLSSYATSAATLRNLCCVPARLAMRLRNHLARDARHTKRSPTWPGTYRLPHLPYDPHPPTYSRSAAASSVRASPTLTRRSTALARALALLLPTFSFLCLRTASSCAISARSLLSSSTFTPRSGGLSSGGAGGRASGGGGAHRGARPGRRAQRRALGPLAGTPSSTPKSNARHPKIQYNLYQEC
eukprot:1068409-Rhodomonas_salina.1